jgi:hypothetical protein
MSSDSGRAAFGNYLSATYPPDISFDAIELIFEFGYVDDLVIVHVPFCRRAFSRSAMRSSSASPELRVTGQP